MKLRLQRRLAAKLLKVGESRIWMDPSKLKELKSAVTRADIAKLISKGAIKSLPEKLPMPRQRVRKRKGPGSRKGGKYAGLGRKRRWVLRIRPLRQMLHELKDSRQIDIQTYKKLYKLVKAGTFKDRSHLRTYLQQQGLIKR